jgi:uncharacterized repeat protein (TIGR02543 family)
VVATRTEAHTIQLNEIQSEYSAETEAMCGGKSCTISGSITLAGQPVAGVKMTGLPGSPKTDAAGRYSGHVPVGWNGAAIPALPGYVFTPRSIHYDSIHSDLNGQNYTAYKCPVITFLSGDHGYLWGDTIQIVEQGGEAQPVLAVADRGYHFVKWTATGGFTSRQNPINLTHVIKDRELTAHFATGPFLTLHGQWEVGNAGPINRNYVKLDVAVSDYQTAAIARYELWRGLDVIKTYTPLDLANGHVAFYDMHAPTDRKNDYMIRAVTDNYTILAESRLLL